MTDKKIEIKWIESLKDASMAWQDIMDSIRKLAPLFSCIAKLEEESKKEEFMRGINEIVIRAQMIHSHAVLEILVNSYNRYILARNDVYCFLSQYRNRKDAKGVMKLL